MNKRELIVRDLFMERYKATSHIYAIPNDIIVKEDKKNNGFILTEIWYSNTPNKPFFWVKNIKDINANTK